MIYAEYYGNSTGWNGKDFSGPVKLIPLCGTDSVVQLDARKTRANQITEAREHASRRASKAKAFRLCAGASFAQRHQRYLTDLISL